jgi:Hint domain-containing protein
MALAISMSALALVAACTPGPTPSPTPGPTILPGPTGGAAMTAGELRLVLIDRLGPRWYCDPDEYPVARGDEQERAIERFPEMLAENDLYTVIATRLGIDPKGSLTDAEKLAVYRSWKVAVSVPLDQVGQGRYRFDYLAQPVAGATEGTRTAGFIDDRGQITIEQEAASGEPPCPICLSRGTRIDTPDGPVQVERLRLGDTIWTLDGAGRRVAATVIALGSTTAPRDHHVIRLVLADGRTVTASPGHPLRDGRLLGDLSVGDTVDGSRVVGLDRLPYPFGETFDILASGETGTYFAGGIPFGSTLRP